MRDANPIRTLGDYSKPSHEGYKNTIELPEGNNVVPFRSDTIWLVQNGCSFHGLWSEDPNQHLKDFLKLVDSLDLNGSITTWEDLTRGEHGAYEDKGWNGPVILEEGNLDYENPNIEHLLGVMEYKVDTLMKDALSLMGGSKSIFRMTSSETYRLSPEPSCQEEFEHIVTNFILD
nr:zinc finger, CCHC-type [Tanacetum cinerariifolium]